MFQQNSSTDINYIIQKIFSKYNDSRCAFRAIFTMNPSLEEFHFSIAFNWTDTQAAQVLVELKNSSDARLMQEGFIFYTRKGLASLAGTQEPIPGTYPPCYNYYLVCRVCNPNRTNFFQQQD